MISDLKFEDRYTYVNHKWLFATAYTSGQTVIGVATPNRERGNTMYVDTPYAFVIIDKGMIYHPFPGQHFDELTAECLLIDLGRKYGFITD